MHSFWTRICAVLLIITLTALLILTAVSGIQIRQPVNKEEAPAGESSYSLGKDTLRLWYTDDKLTDYLNYIAVNYNSDHEDIRVVPVLVPGQEYLESISDASMTDEELPDLYITTNDTLEKAHLAGLAEPVSCPNHTDMRTLFGQTAINAVSYHSEYIAYPLFMECSALCYNYTYVHDWARSYLESEIRANLADEEKDRIIAGENDGSGASDSSTPGQNESQTGTTADNGQSGNTTDKGQTGTSADEAQTGTATDRSTDKKLTPEEQKALEQKQAEEKAKIIDEYVTSQVSEEDVTEFALKSIPSDYDGLLEFSDSFDAPAGVESIFKWAVNDIFYNYFFIGDSISIGGPYGDNVYDIDIYNEDAIRGLMAYQDLNRFFSISTDDVSYQGVVEEFKDGRLVMTITTTDAVKNFADAVKNGETDIDYRFAPLPDMSKDVPARSMSVTDVVAINGYSPNKEYANDFALYLCSADPATLYDWTGKVSVLKDASFGDNTEYIEVFRKEYDRSVPLPKMLETSNYWASLEMLFASVWDGEDANDGLKKLSEQMMLQITGEKFVEKRIEIEPEPDESETEPMS